jgi:hypothetical protein
MEVIYLLLIAKDTFSILTSWERKRNKNNMKGERL